MPQNNPVEILFLSFCKQLLGVQKQTTNVGVLLELGQVPLIVLAQKNAIKNWVRIVTKTNCNKNVINSYDTSVLENLTWSSNIEKTLSEIGLREQFLSNDESAHLKALQRLKDIFHQDAFSDIQRNNSKLRTYSLLKTTPGYEAYLSDIHSIKERTALTKLRLSNHTLMIEKGRHLNIDPNFRFCPFCPNTVEDEKHFLIDCEPYHILRCELFDKAKGYVPSLTQISKNQTFVTLMTATCCISSQFILKATELREFLLSKHKVPD